MAMNEIKMRDYLDTEEAAEEAAFEEVEIAQWPQPIGQAAWHTVAGGIIKQLSQYTEADENAMLVNLLVGYGNMIGRMAYFDVSGDRHYTNLYTAIVGSTSAGRKGTAWAMIMQLLKRRDEAWAHGHVTSGLASGEGLIWQVRDEITKYDAKQKHDVIVDVGVTDKRLLVVESEFAQALKAMQREGNTLSPIIRNAWDGRVTLKAMAKNSPAIATGAHISIIGQITAVELREMLNSTDKLNGFINRFMMVCSRRSKLLPLATEVPPEVLDECANLLPTWPFTNSGRVIRTKEADELWTDIYYHLAQREESIVTTLTARAEAQVLRLSMIFAILEQSKKDDKFIIQPKHIEAAMAVWQYVEDSTRYIFTSEETDSITQQILDALKLAPLTQAQIYVDVFGRHVPAKRIAEALQQLQEKERIRSRKEATAGRPVTIWEIGRP